MSAARRALLLVLLVTAGPGWTGPGPAAAQSPAKAPSKAPSPAPLARRPELARLDALLAAGDTAGADAWLQSLLPAIDKDERLAFDTIYVLVGRDRYDEARAQWNRLGARLQDRLRAPGPADPARRRLLGEAMFTEGLLTAHGGDKAQALKLLQQADGLGFPPLDSSLMLLSAEALFDLQEFGLAVSAYREHLKHEPSSVAARAGLGAALYSAGQIPAARAELEQALRLAPDTPRANYTLGAVLFEQKAFPEASAHLERELALDPRCTPCLARLAHIAYLQGDNGRCESWLAKAMALDASDLETRLVAGLLALRTGRVEAAIEHLSRVVERAPEFATARFQLAAAYRQAGQPERAREQLEVYQRLLKEQKAREMGFRGEK